MKYKKLFEPTKIGNIQLKNRFAMGPMGNIGYGDAFGAFNQRIVDYYVERAKNGVGLIITGICPVTEEIEGFERGAMPCPTASPIHFIWEGTQMNERIHAYGTKTLIQLTAGLGRSAIPGLVKNYIAPSENENRFDETIIHRMMTKEEINKMTDAFVQSAVISQKAGFDGVEIHAVHEGYLLDQFAIAFYNHRKDEYGGDLENRLRFATDIVKGIKQACGKDFVVSLRYSIKSYMKGLRQGAVPGEVFDEVGKDTEEGIKAAKLLVEAGYDSLDCDAGTYDSWYWNHPPMYFEDGMYRDLCTKLYGQVDVPILEAGRMDNPEMAMEELGKSCDIIVLARPLLADPEIVQKIRFDKLDEIRPCLGCHEGCLGRVASGPVQCAVNPQAGRESIYGLQAALTKKTILVVGGGIAGMEVARVCKLRGHNVTLVEKSNELGGNLLVGSKPHFKRNDKRLVNYYIHQLELLNVEVKFNTTITSSNIDSMKADIIVTATGSVPRTIEVKGPQKVVTADEVLLGHVKTGKDIVIIGGGLVGCETGLWLAEETGAKVTVVEIAKQAHAGLPHMNEYMLTDLLAFNHVDILTESSVLETKKNSVLISTPSGEKEIKADTVIGSVGYISTNKLYKELEYSDKLVYNIGDSAKVHNIMYSIWNAYELARNL